MRRFYMRRWPWWSPVRWLPGAVLFGGLLVLSVIAARDALAHGLQYDLAAFAAGTVVASVATASARPRSRMGPLLLGTGSIVAAVGLAGLFAFGLIWQGFVAFCVLIACAVAPVVIKAVWPLRAMTDDEARAYLTRYRAWRITRTPPDRLGRILWWMLKI